jgi:sulfatase maturation enzyme AslB (radical SAM superfamily)
MSFYSNTLKVLDIESSSYCNAKCPHCVRESRNGDYDFFTQTNLTTDFFENHIPKDVVTSLHMVSFCGNMGEPAMNKHMPDILRWFRKINPNIFLEIYTNGSVQNPDWWFEIGTIIGDNGNVIFAIDGLEDTNHIYRINVKWDHLINNITEYIKSGAQSTWQLIPFKHNEHQIEEARDMAFAMGFTNFKIKISHRDLLNQPQNVNNAVLPPKNPLYKHSGNKLDFNRFDNTENYLNNVDIKCSAIETGNIYISSEGLVFPCCHTASIFLIDENIVPEPYNWIKNIKQDFDLTEISLYENDLSDIITSNTFNRIKDSWNLNMKQGRNPLCAAVCGKFNNSESLMDGLINNAYDKRNKNSES